MERATAPVSAATPMPPAPSPPPAPDSRFHRDSGLWRCKQRTGRQWRWRQRLGKKDAVVAWEASGRRQCKPAAVPLKITRDEPRAIHATLCVARRKLALGSLALVAFVAMAGAVTRLVLARSRAISRSGSYTYAGSFCSASLAASSRVGSLISSARADRWGPTRRSPSRCNRRPKDGGSSPEAWS